MGDVLGDKTGLRRLSDRLRLLRVALAAFTAVSAAAGEVCLLVGVPLGLPGSLTTAETASSIPVLMAGVGFTIALAIFHAVAALLLWQRCAGAEGWAVAGLVLLTAWIVARLVIAPVTALLELYLLVALTDLDFLVARTGLFGWGLGRGPTRRRRRSTPPRPTGPPSPVRPTRPVPRRDLVGGRVR